MRRPTIIATDKTIYKITRDEIAKYGDTADLNHIDVSNVTDMAWMFQYSQFNGDISQWDVSNVTDMGAMFSNSVFNSNIAQWNVSNVMNMYAMFMRSEFNGDLSAWSLHADCNVNNMMFGIKNYIVPPFLCVDSIAAYRDSLSAMVDGTDQWMNEIAQSRGTITANHGVYLLLLPDVAPENIHSELTREDTKKLQMLYQLTRSVYQSVKLWYTQRKNKIQSMDSNITALLCN